MEVKTDLSENLKSYLANRFLSASEKRVIEDLFWVENNNAFHRKPI